ncbi:MAG: pyridoxal-phosphate dependent enzyme [Thermomicrobiales bacterium]
MTETLHRRHVPTPTAADLAAAREAVAANLAPTPLIPSPAAGDGVWLKLETFQPTGSFKVRGAIAACAALPPGSRVVTASAGNHGLGIGWASGRLGIPATIVVAETASPAKRDAIARMPVELILHGTSVDAAEFLAMDLAADPARAATYVSPYNDPHVIAGQSTLLDEVVAQVPGDGTGRPLTVVAGVGGGGLVSGLALRAAELSTPQRPITVVGVEAAESMALSAAVSHGDTIEVPIGDTIADGLSGNLEPGAITADIIRSHGVHLLAAPEQDLHRTVRWLVRNHGLVTEGAGAAPLAAQLAGAIGGTNGDVVLVVSGRNIALPKLAAILAEPDPA